MQGQHESALFSLEQQTHCFAELFIIHILILFKNFFIFHISIYNQLLFIYTYVILNGGKLVTCDIDPSFITMAKSFGCRRKSIKKLN